MRFAAVFAALLLACASAPQTARNTSAVLLPRPAGMLASGMFGKANSIGSPDGRHALWGDYEQSRLWMEDTATHEDRPIDTFTVRTISLAWSPDSRHFVVNDRPTSSESTAYLFDTETLQRTNLGDKLTAVLPEVRRYFLLTEKDCPHCGTVSHGRDVMHSFLDVRRWLDDQHVELQLHGNFSGRFRNDNTNGHLYSAGCFDVRFRMGLDGSVKKLSERIMEPIADDTACGWGPDE